MPYAQHHGKQIVRDYYKKTATGQAKSWIVRKFWQAVYLGAVSSFVLAGYCAAENIINFHLGMLV